MDFEQEKRRRDVEYAIASGDQEILTGEFGNLAEKYIAGQISLQQWGDYVLQACTVMG